MSVAGILGAVVDCRPNEVRPAILLFAHAFFLGLAGVFYQTLSNTVFLTYYKAADLPYVYMAAVLFSGSAAFLFTKLGARVRISLLLAGVLGTMWVAIVLFRAGLSLPDPKPVVLILRMWWEAMYLLSELMFWVLAGRIFDLRQGKRLFGVIGSGNVLAQFCGGLSIPFLSRVIAVQNLFFVSAAAMGLCMLVYLVIYRNYPASFVDAQAQGHAPKNEAISFGMILRNRYLVLVAVVFAAYYFVLFFIDFAFYIEVENHQVGEQAIASFLGTFFAVVGLVSLLGQSIFGPWYITRFGVTRGLLVLPVVLLIGTGLLSLIGMTGVGMAAVFWIMAATKMMNVVLGVALQEPCTRILYQPLPPHQRSSFQAIVEGIVGTGTSGVAGAALLGCTALMAFTSVQAADMVVFLIAGWIALTFALGHAYADMLQACLARRKLDPQILSLNDNSSRQMLTAWLRSPDPNTVIYALHLLADEQHASLEGLLLPLLDHADPEVRRQALERIERQRLLSVRGPVKALLAKETSGVVLGMALRAYLSLSEGEAFDDVLPHLADARPEVRKGAMVGLMHHGGIEGILAVGERLIELLRSSRAQDRVLAAGVLGDVANQSFYRPLLALLQDAELDVRRAALQAAARIGNPALWPCVIDNLHTPQLTSLAVAALRSGGVPAVRALEQAWTEERCTLEMRVRLLRVCWHLPDPQSAVALRRLLHHAEPSTRREVFHGLDQLKYRVSADRDDFRMLVHEECGRAVNLLAAQQDLGAECGEVLRRALQTDLRHHLDNMLLLCSFLYPDKGIADARTHLESQASATQSLAIEILDNRLPRELKELIFPFVEPLPLEARLERLRGVAATRGLSTVQRLEQLAGAAVEISCWTRTCSLYEIGRTQRRELKDVVARQLAHAEALIKETAAWTHARLE